MAAVLRLREDAYGVAIHAKTDELVRPRSISPGAVYYALDRLEDQGLVSSRLADPTPERGYRAKRFYWIEALGELAFEESALTSRECGKEAGLWNPSRPKWHPVRPKWSRRW